MAFHVSRIFLDAPHPIVAIRIALKRLSRAIKYSMWVYFSLRASLATADGSGKATDKAEISAVVNVRFESMSRHTLPGRSLNLAFIQALCS